MIVSVDELKLINVPILYPCNEDLESFKRLKNICDKVNLFVGCGRQLLLWSNKAGNGKTTWCQKICNAYQTYVYNKRYDAVKEYDKAHPNSNVGMVAPKNSYLIVSVGKYLSDLKNGMNFYDVREKNYDLEQQMLNVPLLVLDDIGMTACTEYEKEQLYNIINYRIYNKLSTLYTTNCNIEQLYERVGDRLADRIVSDTVIELKGLSHRTKL